MTRGKVTLTVEEIISTLKHSFVTSIIVEGSDDLVVYRRIENQGYENTVSVLPVGGREAVLQLFERRSEFASGGQVVFVADRDVWVYSGVPNDYVNDSLILTHGYSIENDIIKDGEFCNMMSVEERDRFNSELDIVLKWYSTALRMLLDGSPAIISTHPNELLANEILLNSLDNLLENDADARVILDHLKSDPFGLLRGKTLLATMMRQLSYPGRAARHHHLALLESVAANPKSLLTGLFERVAIAVGAH